MMLLPITKHAYILMHVGIYKLSKLTLTYIKICINIRGFYIKRVATGSGIPDLLVDI